MNHAHDWQRIIDAEVRNGPHVFYCAECDAWGWRKRFRKNKNAPVEQVKPYSQRRAEKVAARMLKEGREEVKVTAKPMSGRRALHGGYVPPGSRAGWA